MDVDARGRVYATFGTNECHVRVYDEKGELVDFPRREKDVPAAITGVTGYGGSLRVDAEGNLYLLQAGVPKGFPVPPGFEKDEAFRQALGTIYKFPPAGGEIETRNGSVVSVKGAIATYPGCGPVSRWNAVGSCACTKPRFDVDDYGRLYVPNAITFTVSVRDNADNEIARFGSYGNYDASGPEIPLGWPVTAGASDRFIYVGDALNHRVVRADKRFALEASVDLPAR
jgi:DNA-binding beta-propeller fold protein YncE